MPWCRPSCWVRFVVVAGIASGCGSASDGTGATEAMTESTQGGEAEADAGEHPSAIEALGISGPDVPWEEMSDFDREMYMVGKVLPIMQELFRGHDPERYAEVACETCHGEEMREVEFRMPVASMFVVPPEGTPAYESMVATFPETVRFMREDVTPAMGTMLGADGFTCAGCHPTAAP